MVCPPNAHIMTFSTRGPRYYIDRRVSLAIGMVSAHRTNEYNNRIGQHLTAPGLNKPYKFRVKTLTCGL